MDRAETQPLECARTWDTRRKSCCIFRSIQVQPRRNRRIQVLYPSPYPQLIFDDLQAVRFSGLLGLW